MESIIQDVLSGEAIINYNGLEEKRIIFDLLTVNFKVPFETECDDMQYDCFRVAVKDNNGKLHYGTLDIYLSGGYKIIQGIDFIMVSNAKLLLESVK